MKCIDTKEIANIPGVQLGEDDAFSFQCHPDVSCFNKCCHNLNLFLYPYDVLRLKKRLGITSDIFIEKYVDIVLRENNYFPDVPLRMADTSDRACPFLSENGCSVYSDRPGTCRMFPVEQGMLFGKKLHQTELLNFYRPPDFCRGQHEPRKLTVREWISDQDAKMHNKMTVSWAQVKQMFQTDPWGMEGPNGSKGKMAFMAVYNLDQFRAFIFNSSFLKRYKVKQVLLKKLRHDDVALLNFGFAWILFTVFGVSAKEFRLR